MQKHTPRRAAPEPTQTGPKLAKPVLIGLSALAIAGVVGGSVLLLDNGKEEATPATEASSQPASIGCAAKATVLVDDVWMAAAQRAAEDWAKEVGGGDCSPVELVSADSATIAKRGLDKADGWIPEDPTWQEMASNEKLRAGSQVTLGNSPLVIAQPKDAANAMKVPLAGAPLAGMVAGGINWGQFGHPEWGSFKLVSPDNVTTVIGARGQDALMKSVGNGERPSGNPFGGTPAQTAMAGVQQRVVATVKPAKVVDELGPHPEDATGVNKVGPRAGLTTAALVLPHADELTATPLGDGAGIEMALVDPGDNATLTAWTRWMKDKGDASLAAAGLDTAKQSPDPELLKQAGLPAEKVKVRDNTVAELEAARGVLSAYSKRYSVFMVLDNSGSMAERLPDGQKRISVVQNLMQTLWDRWPSTMSSGLMTFNASNETNEPQIKTLVPLQTTAGKQWADNSPQYRKAVNEMAVEGGTPLYDAIATAWQYNMNNYQTGADNRIVVLTDGRDGDAKQKVNYNTLLKVLPKEPDAARPIKVLYVGLGDEADMATLNKIAKLTGQQAVQARTTQELAGAMGAFVQPR